ncbi:hypothetical protein SUDANB178_07439 [Streptomyces sp. enrichment culture]
MSLDDHGRSPASATALYQPPDGPHGSPIGRWGSLPPDACTSALRALADHHRPALADHVALAENRLPRRQGSRGRLRSRCAAVRVRPAGKAVESPVRAAASAERGWWDGVLPDCRLLVEWPEGAATAPAAPPRGWTGTPPVWSALARHWGSLPVRTACWWPQAGEAACQVVIWSSVRTSRVMVGWAGVVWCRSVAVALTWPGVSLRVTISDEALWLAGHQRPVGVCGGNRVDGCRGVEGDVDGSGPAGAEADLDRLRGADVSEPVHVAEVHAAHPEAGGGLFGSERGVGGDHVSQVLAPADLVDLAGVVQCPVGDRGKVGQQVAVDEPVHHERRHVRLLADDTGAPVRLAVSPLGVSSVLAARGSAVECEEGDSGRSCVVAQCGGDEGRDSRAAP